VRFFVPQNDKKEKINNPRRVLNPSRVIEQH
jgi:hypothetical protein